MLHRIAHALADVEKQYGKNPMTSNRSSAISSISWPTKNLLQPAALLPMPVLLLQLSPIV
jgi:hypothetical protein